MTTDDELAIVNARMVAYLQFPGVGREVASRNDWDLGELDRFLAHPLFQGMGGSTADQAFHREALLDVAATLPREWITSGNAVGTSEACSRHALQYLSAGADELVLHGANAAQNSDLLAALRAG
jgi:hypothetical protein